MNAQDAWNAALSQLELQLDRTTFEMWLRGAVLMQVEDNTFVVGVKSMAARDMLAQRLYRNVRKVVSDVYGHPVELRFELKKSSQPARSEQRANDLPLFRLMAEQGHEIEKQASSLAALESHTAPLNQIDTLQTPDTTVPLHQRIARPKLRDLPESTLNDRFTFDRFIAGSSNQMIYEAALAVAEKPGMNYNPFFVYGGVGVGKTHMLQAIAHAYRSRGLRVLYVTSEAFTNDLIDSFRSKTQAMFRERYRSADALVIDDIQFLKDKESTQEEFFHTFNSLSGFNKQIVIASDEHPERLTTLEARLRSRFEGGLVMEVKLPDLETRIAILKMWAEEAGMHLDANVLEYVAARVHKHMREMQGVFKKLLANQQITRESISVEEAASEISGFHRPRYAMTMHTVIETVAEHHGMTAADLIGPRRTGLINQARQIAMLLCRELTNSSLPQIGDAFGGRKHSTVLYSIQRANDEMEQDDAICHVVESIRTKLIHH
ncbi:MAG: chromosomal replication initiator protein DnaA [Pleurocapsa minor GSE-CHR-MK-17-07R]|nr:chromosomal replication initiator protein DnaA [Pleurocapsa minor GSE-CHR-MK 17-07R]